MKKILLLLCTLLATVVGWAATHVEDYISTQVTDAAALVDGGLYALRVNGGSWITESEGQYVAPNAQNAITAQAVFQFNTSDEGATWTVKNLTTNNYWGTLTGAASSGTFTPAAEAASWTFAFNGSNVTAASGGYFINRSSGVMHGWGSGINLQIYQIIDGFDAVSATELSNTKSYTLYCKRGFLSTSEGHLANTVKAGLGLTAKNFALLTYQDATFLYSVEDAKFVENDGTLGDTPTAITLNETTAPTYQIKFGDNYLNATTGATYGAVIDNWDTADDGNQYYLIEADDFDSKDALAVIYEAFRLFADGKYYLNNVGTGKYLSAGSNWGTHAFADDFGLDYDIKMAEGKYTLDSQVSNGGAKHFLNGEWNDGVAMGWIFDEVSEGVYTISDGTNFLTAGENGVVTLAADATVDAAKWTLVPAATRAAAQLATLDAATAESGVDATFLIKGANFNRNDLRNSAWTATKSGANQTIGGPDGDRASYGCESWNNTFEVSQTLENIPEGVYEFSIAGYGTNGTTYVFANETEAAFVNTTGAANFGAALDAIAAGEYKGNTTGQVNVLGETLKIGVKRTSQVGQDWAVFDNARLTYYGPVPASAYQPAYDSALAAAKAALDNEDYAAVTGEEKAALTKAYEDYSSVEETIEAYKAAISALSAATLAFTGAKGDYDALVAAKAATAERNYKYADADKKAAAEATLLVEATSAADAKEKAAAIWTAFRQYAESHALAEGVEDAINMTAQIVNPNAEEAIAEPWAVVLGEGSGGSLNILDGEPLTDGDGNNKYKYFDGGNWGANAWDVALKQTITLPAGKYMITVSGRASGDVQLSLLVGEEKTAIPAIGASGGLFGFGWDDASKEFELEESGDVVIGVQGVTEKQYNWMSFTRFRLVCLEKAEEPIVPADYTSYIANADLTKTAEEAGWDATGTKGIDGSGIVKVGNAAAFDFKQTIENLPAGKYKVTAQAAYRYGGDEQAEYDAIQTENVITKLVQLYATVGTKTVKQLVQNRYDGASETDYADGNGSTTVNGKFVPNSSGAVKAWFAAGQYVNEVIFNLPADGAVTIGINRIATPESDYTVIGPWTLTRLGDAEIEPEPVVEPGTDMTEHIINPSFETGDLTGWTVVASDDTGVKPNSNATYTTEGCDGDYLFNTWWKGNPITQTVTGLPNGQYELKALMANNAGDGNNDKPCLYLLANGEHSEAFSSGTAGKFAEGSMQFYVTDGTATIGAIGGNADGTFNADGYYWYKVDNFRLTFVEALPNIDDIEIPEGKMSNAAAAAITAAKEAGDVVALLDAVTAAKASIAAYANVKKVIDNFENPAEKTNVYTAEAKAAFDTYFATVQAGIDALSEKYEAGTLSDEEATAATNPLVFGWHADNQFDDFLLSAWSINEVKASDYDTALYINGWSTEGDTDGSEFKVPFFEYWTGDGESLGANTLSAEMTDLEAGEYDVTAWVRVRIKNGAEAPATGITFQANEGAAVNVADGAQIGTSQFYLKEATATGIVGEDGKLTIKFNIAEDNNISWLSFKNVKFAKKGDAPTTYAINIVPSENGKVEANPTTAAEGETVTIHVIPDEGYMVDEVHVTYGEDQNIEFETLDMETLTGTFLMPAADVNVLFTFKVKEDKEPEVTATLVHTAGASWGSNTGKNTVDTAAEYYNNEASTGWAGVAFAEFDFSNLPNGATITEATLFWNATNLNVNGDRNNYVYYLNADQAVDYEGIATSEKEQLFSGVKTLLENVVAPKGTSNIEGKTTATDALNELIAAGQKKIIFQFTGNGGGANLHGKAAEDAPQLVIKYMPGAPEVPNASFEADGEKAASNGAIEMTGWTFAGVGTQFNNTELRPAGSTSTTSQFGTSDPSDGEYSLFFRQGWNGGGNVFTITSAALDEIPAGDYTLSIDYKQHYSYDNDDQKNDNTKVTIALKKGEDILGSETSPAAAGVKGGSGDATYFNDTEWSTLTASFTIEKAVAAGAQVVITLNSAGARRSDFFLDNVQLVRVPGVEAAKLELQKAIEAAQAEAAKYIVGEGIFMYAETEIAPLTNAIATATEAYNSAEATKESVNAAKDVLTAFVEAFVPVATQPEADKTYTFQLRLGGETALYMNLTEGGIAIAEEATPLKFIVTDAAGQFNLANADETLFVGLAGGDAWTMSTAADKKAAWTFTVLADGAYRINNLVTAGRFVGTNSADKEAGKPCYADKLTSNGNVDWIIAEYIAPAPEAKEYNGIIEQTVMSREDYSVAGTSTSDQTVTVVPAGEGKVSVTFSGFTIPLDAPMPFTVSELTIEATAISNEDGSVSYAADGFQVSVQMGMMSINYTGKLEGIKTSADAVPGFRLTLTQASIDEIYFAADAEALAALKESYFTPVGIKGIATPGEKAFIYDLSGRKVEKMVKGGIYIVNGKKVSFK